MTQLVTTSTWSCEADTLKSIFAMRSLAVKALSRMYLPHERLFGWCVRRGANLDKLEGLSARYTAIVLIGLAAQEHEVTASVFPEGNADACMDRLLGELPKMANLGDVALTLWAAVALHRSDADLAFSLLREMAPDKARCPTVELSWALSSLSANADFLTDGDLARRVAARLLRSFNDESELFPHWPVDLKSTWRRRHVLCFADWVYPVQALSLYHAVSGDEESIGVARRSAARMCELQGSAGQWWWHYDVRTGRVIERYPVYAVHQDAMAPMALFDLQDACGVDHSAAIRKGLNWLACSAERGDSLVDGEAGLIWRKVCRQEPGKLSRVLQAAASRVSPAIRAPLPGFLFKPTRVDYECRPYHLGWLLYAFSDRRVGIDRRVGMDRRVPSEPRP